MTRKNCLAQCLAIKKWRARINCVQLECARSTLGESIGAPCPVLIAACKRGSGHGQMKASYLPVCVRPSGNVTFNWGFAFHKTARLRAWRPVSPAPIPTARGLNPVWATGARGGCRQIRVAGKSDAPQASGMPRCCRQIRVAGKSEAPRGCRQDLTASNPFKESFRGCRACPPRSGTAHPGPGGRAGRKKGVPFYIIIIYV